MNENEQLKAEIKRIKSWNKWFYSRVKFMRECQKEYFSLGNKIKKLEENPYHNETTIASLRDQRKKKLGQSKSLETEIDNEITRIETVLMKNSETVQELMIAFDAVETN